MIMQIKQKMRQSSTYSAKEIIKKYPALNLPDDYIALDRP